MKIGHGFNKSSQPKIAYSLHQNKNALNKSLVFFQVI